MQDFCFHGPDEAAILAALTAVGLTVAGIDGSALPVGEYAYAGPVVETPGQCGPDHMQITPPVMLPGVYAVYRATDDQAAALLAATLPESVALVEPPAGLPRFGGEWLAGPALADLKSQACTRIAVECAKRRTAGVQVEFPDGPGIVQTRDDLDLINVTGVSSAGLAATVSGDTPDLYFRDEANNNHTLLPTQAVHFGAQVMQRLQAITRAAHDAKDAINAPSVTTAAQVLAIEAAMEWPA